MSIFIRSSMAAAALLLAAPAIAGPTLGVDLDFSGPLGQDSTALGTGGELRAGYALKIPMFTFTPELGAHWYGSGSPIVPKLGARARIGAGVQPGVYGHALFGTTPLSPAPVGFDVGGLLDLTMVPGVDFGVHAGLLQMGAAGPLQPADRSVVGGLHISFDL